MFYWIESLQSYSVGGWEYKDELHKFVDNGMAGNSFIDAVSGIVNRGASGGDLCLFKQSISTSFTSCSSRLPQSGT